MCIQDLLPVANEFSSRFVTGPSDRPQEPLRFPSVSLHFQQFRLSPPSRPARNVRTQARRVNDAPREGLRQARLGILPAHLSLVMRGA